MPLAEAAGAVVLQFRYAGGWPKKRQWALDTHGWRNDWILVLDADEILTEPLKFEIDEAVRRKGHDGYWLSFQIVFLGRTLRHGDTEFRKLSLFQRTQGRYEQRLAQQDVSMSDIEVHEHVVVSGRVGRLRHAVRHENWNSLDRYITKHNEYSNWEAGVFLNGADSGLRPSLFGNQAQRRRWLKRTFLMLPGSPAWWFLYGYVVHLGFLDGRAGFVYAMFRFVQAFHVKAKNRRTKAGAREMSLTSAARVLLVAAIAWGAFAFGAVYSWAYWPVVAAALTVALTGLLATGSVGWRQLNLTSLSIALVCLLVACAVQVVPLPWKWVGAISPQAPEVIVQLDVAARLGLTASHPLSIDPVRSLRGLIVLGSLAFLVVGATRLFSITGVFGVAIAIATIGALLALTGIIQRPMYTGKIYGFWSPLQTGASPFGPFVNRNHFAGWMLMGLPLTIGLLGSCIARDNWRVGPDFRGRILWLSSPSASTQMLLLGAVGLMALSLTLTTSRSGISAAALAVVTVLLSFRRRLSPRKGVVAVAAVSTVIVLVIAWAGTSAVASRFTSGRTNDLDARMGIWKDTARIAALYPIAGTGLNTFSVATVFYQEFDPAKRYLQAHNDYLQLAAEGGLLLSVPAAICVTVFGWSVRRRFAEDTSRTRVLDSQRRGHRTAGDRAAGDSRFQPADAWKRVHVRGAVRYRAAQGTKARPAGRRERELTMFWRHQTWSDERQRVGDLLLVLTLESDGVPHRHPPCPFGVGHVSGVDSGASVCPAECLWTRST